MTAAGTVRVSLDLLVPVLVTERIVPPDGYLTIKFAQTASVHSSLGASNGAATAHNCLTAVIGSCRASSVQDLDELDTDSTQSEEDRRLDLPPTSEAVWLRNAVSPPTVKMRPGSGLDDRRKAAETHKRPSISGG
jgi:hypothetical protein